MKSHEFYEKFANLPLDKRSIVLDKLKYDVLDYSDNLGDLTMSGLYYQMEELQKELRPLKIKEQELLDIAEEYFNKLDK